MEDSSDLISKLSSILKEKNIDINDVLNNISNSNSNSSTASAETVDNFSQESATENSVLGDLDFETIIKLKTVMEKMNSSNNSTRNKLLMSLKPYLRESRKDKLDTCIKLANMSSLIELFKTNN